MRFPERVMCKVIALHDHEKDPVIPKRKKKFENVR